MTEEILINVTPAEVRVARVEDRNLVEIVIERASQTGLLGNIYKGKVSRVLPGLQAAFIDIGLERAAFLHVSDIKESDDTSDIADLIRQDQPIIVQVYKDSLGSKGVRVTTRLSIPSRFLVLTPGVAHIGVSQKITDLDARQRLLSLLTLTSEDGYIFRTAAVSARLEEIQADQLFLQKLMATILADSRKAKMGELIYAEIPILCRLLRDFSMTHVEHIRVDQEKAMIEMRKFATIYSPELTEKIVLHREKISIFNFYSIEDQLEKALHRKLYLKSGGYLIMDQTEAMVTIDVNSGSYLGRRNARDTAFKTNVEAIDVIARHIRLRNLGGIIIIDFIDMSNPAHQSNLLELLQAALLKDHAKIEMSELTSLGLVQLTRQRTRESLEHVLCVPCPLCHKRGSIKSWQTIGYAIFRELEQSAHYFSWPGFRVLASEKVIDYILSEGAAMLADITLKIGRPIECHVEATYTQEQYDILPLSEKD